MAIKCMSRPAVILDGAAELAAEFSAARWTHHRLLDFEDHHQRLLDEVAEQCAPGIRRVARLIAILWRRQRRAERASAGSWKPRERANLMAALRSRLAELRKQRDADPRWREALLWADGVDPDAPERGKPRRKAGETAEEFAERCSKRRTRLTRREAHRAALYAERRVYWGTWNALIASVDAARKAVIQQRKSGVPASWKRPRWDDPCTISADAGGFRIVERGRPWWVVEMRLLEGWVRFRAKLGNWHELPETATLKQCKLTRRKNGRGWEYSVSIAVDGMPDASAQFATRGTVALDWGHREHGHDHEREGMRVFAWVGDDGRSGEILLPRECRELLDQLHATQARIDQTFDARRRALNLPERNRHSYRSRLMRSGVRTEEEARWLAWETRYERRLMRIRKRIQNLRRETYLQAARELRRHYRCFAVEDEKIAGRSGLRRQAQEAMEFRRKRQNRELSARYEFVQMLERLGGEQITVSARNTTRECPDCGELAENTPDLLVACPACGVVRDKDFGAARVILRRAQEALASAGE